MRAPRRIFRPARKRLSPAMLLFVLPVSAITAWSQLDHTWAASPAPIRLVALAGDVTAVGADTLRLAGQVVRLRGVSECKGCGVLNPLARFVQDRPVTCIVAGADQRGRALADCDVGGVSLASLVMRQRSNSPNFMLQ